MLRGAAVDKKILSGKEGEAEVPSIRKLLGRVETDTQGFFFTILIILNVV